MLVFSVIVTGKPLPLVSRTTTHAQGPGPPSDYICSAYRINLHLVDGRRTGRVPGWGSGSVSAKVCTLAGMVLGVLGLWRLVWGPLHTSGHFPGLGRLPR